MQNAESHQLVSLLVIHGSGERGGIWEGMRLREQAADHHAGMVAGLGFSPYVASKFAVVGMSEGLAMQLKPHGIGVTVLCPGFVRTRINESGRNRPARYGKPAVLDPASAAAALVAEISTLIQAGLDPSEVAARVLAAIREDELYVFTHPEMREELDRRFTGVGAAMDKAAAV